ncbi:MAG: hypothetical protein IT435_00680 [Phycisphaerales bacterium]|nr:hypothetical protein [Phycisphaerales bacterium]
MMLDDIREALRHKPFVPFTLHLADGRSARVNHPELILVPPGKTRTLVLATPAGRIRLIDALLVVEIEVDESKPRSRRAG